VDTSISLSINSLTSFGRLDVICRCISAAFFLSNDFRKNTDLYIFFIKNTRILHIDGSLVQGINPDERAIAGILKRVFKGMPVSGIRFYNGELQDLITKFQPIMLDIHGEENQESLRNNPSFIIGDQIGYPKEYEEVFSALKRISLGVNEYLSSQTISILNFILDQI
jgi:tRNA (pseudouridine54-N1)-methyltransferase